MLASLGRRARLPAAGPRPSDPRLFNWVNLADTPVGDDGAMRRPQAFASLHGYQPRVGDARTWWRALTLLVIAVPEQLATSRLAGMPPITGFYAFVAGSVLFALLGSNPQMSVGADSTIAPLFAAGVSALALTGSPHYVELVGDPGRHGRAHGDAGEHPAARLDRRVPVDAHRDRLPVRRGRDHHHPPAARLPRSAPDQRVEQHRVGYVFTHLGEVNGWTLAIGLGVLVVMFVCARLDRRIPGALIGMVGSTALVAALGLQAHGVAVLGTDPDRGPAPRADRAVVVDARESGAAGRRGGAGRRDPDRGDHPGLRRAGRLRRRRRARLPRRRRGQRGRRPGGLVPGRRQPAPHRGRRHRGWPHPGRRPRGRGWSSSSSSRWPNVLQDVPLATLAAILIFVALRLFNAGRSASPSPASTCFEFGLAAVTLLTVVLVGVEQGIGVAVGLAILDRIRLSARPQLHVLGRIPGTTSWAPLAAEFPAAEVPGVLVLLFATPLWYANAVHFRDEVVGALGRAPGTRVLVLDTIGMSDVDFTGSRALGHVLDAVRAPARRLRRGAGGRPPARDPAAQRPGAAHRREPLLPDRRRGGHRT